MLLTQNKTRNIFYSILSSDKDIVILYYNENYKNKNSDKPYIVVVVCLLVVESMKAVKSSVYRDLLGFLLRGVYGVSLEIYY